MCSGNLFLTTKAIVHKIVHKNKFKQTCQRFKNERLKGQDQLKLRFLENLNLHGKF